MLHGFIKVIMHFDYVKKDFPIYLTERAITREYFRY